jgi:hypothetical protein
VSTESNQNRPAGNVIRTGSFSDKVWDNGFYVSGKLDVQEVEFLIDSGATCSILSSTVYQNMPKLSKYLLTPFASPVFDAGSNQINCHGQTALEVTLNGCNFNIDVLVCDISQDGIIGQDFLLKYVEIIDYKSGKLVTHCNEIPCFVGSEKSFSCRVIVRRTIVIPANSAAFVSVGISNKDKLTKYSLAEPIGSANPHCLMLPGVLTTNDSDLKINYVNCSDSSVTLHENQSVGTCEPYIDQEIFNKVQVRSVTPTSENKIVNPSRTDLPEHLKDLYDRSSKFLAKEECHQLALLLLKYSSVFAKHSSDLGKCNRVQHRINTGQALPIKQPLRRLPLAKQEAERNEVKKMLEQDVIEASKSPWASPVVIVTKKDSTVRFCCDYRQLNDVTVKDAYPLPRTDACLDSLAGATWFSQMDLCSGFWQIEMAPEDREKTAFATSLGLYQWVCMPFGLANSPSTFQRCMEDVLRGLQWVELVLYMDDITSPANTISEGLERLSRIFDRLVDANLKLKPSKCAFFQKKITFLGHIVSEEGVSTDPEKIKAVHSWPVPTSVKEMRSFLGLASYYRRFVEGFAKIARPLHKLCEKGIKFCWNEDANSAFETLKQALTSAPILAYPITGLSYIIDCDASDLAVGGVLSQVQNGHERVIAYMSKGLSKCEKNYCATRKELLAAVMASRTFHPYIYGQKTLLRTDNAAVSWIKKLKTPSGQMARWLQELETYDLDVVHRPGLKHTNADALSRRPCKVCERQENLNNEDTDSDCDNNLIINQNNSVTIRAIQQDAQIVINGWTPDDLLVAQLNDPNISPILNAKTNQLDRPSWDQISDGTSFLKTLWRMWDRLKVINQILYCIFIDTETGFEQNLLIVPLTKRDEIIKYSHDIPSAGHLGLEKSLHRLKQSFYWPGMKEDVHKYITKCDKCACRKSNTAPKAPMRNYINGEPMERISIDVLGPLSTTLKGNKYILVVVDNFTKWTEAYPLPNQEAKTIADVLVNNFICRFGCPQQILSDKGTNFTSQLFQDICDFLHIDKVTTSSLRPQSNGCPERFNRTLQSMLAIYCEDDQQRWDEYLPQLTMAYRASVHSSTGVTPNKMVFGRDVTLPVEAFIGSPNSSIEARDPESYCSQLQTVLVSCHTIARKSLRKNTAYQKRHYDIKAKKRSFSVGQAVWLYNPIRRIGVCSKLTCKWKGPYVITRKLDDITYLVKNGLKLKPKVYHIDRLIPYKGNHIPSWFAQFCN